MIRNHTTHLIQSISLGNGKRTGHVRSFALSLQLYGVVDQRLKKKCRDKPAHRNGAGKFEEETPFRVQCLTMMPIHQKSSEMASIAAGNFFNALNEH